MSSISHTCYVVKQAEFCNGFGYYNDKPKFECLNKKNVSCVSEAQQSQFREWAEKRNDQNALGCCPCILGQYVAISRFCHSCPRLNNSVSTLDLIKESKTFHIANIIHGIVEFFGCGCCLFPCDHAVRDERVDPTGGIFVLQNNANESTPLISKPAGSQNASRD